jgi:hypothetical protein
MDIKELAKLTGEKWKNLSDEDKQPFNDLAAADKVRAQEQVI